MGIRNLLKVPDVTRALLLDMDGVIIDSLALDLSLVPQMIQLKWPDRGRDLLDASIRRHFPEPLPEFWRSIAVDLDLGISEEELVALIESHDEARALQRFDLCPGVEEIIREGSKAGLWIAVVSNNQVSDIRSILEPTGLMNLVDALIGLEQSGGVPKPEPDIYLEAVKAASQIADMSLPITMMTKETVNRAYETTLSEGVRFERRLFYSMFATEDKREGMAAFIDKRPAKFEDR